MSYMPVRLKNTIYSNASFLIVVLGSLGSFLSVIFLKKFLPESFTVYSLYITFIGIAVSFGFAGFDQVLLRHSKVIDSRVGVEKDIIYVLFALLFFVPFVLAYYFQMRFNDLNFLSLLFSGISVNLILLAYNLLRLKKSFFISQLFNSGYKFLFLFVVAFLFLTKRNLNTNFIVTICTTLLIIIAFFACFFIFRSVVMINKKTVSLGNYFFSFSINLGLLTLLSHGERIFIATELGEDVFAKYFYYSTIFLFPLTLIQYYIGFKELVFFKEKVDKKLIHQKIKKVFIIGTLLILIIFLIVNLEQGHFLDIAFKENILFIVLLSILGLVKLNYGLFSALLGARGEFRDIYKVNILTFILISICFAFLILVKINIELVVASLIFIFSSRIAFIYKNYV